MLIWPAQNNQNNAGVANAETYVQDGITYETIYLPGDSDPTTSRNAVRTWGGESGNYHYILMDDWDLVTNKYDRFACGTNIIFDFNGHTVKYARVGDVTYYLKFAASVKSIEFTDTSAAGGGGSYCLVSSSEATLIFSGNGRYDTESGGASTAKVIIRGGQRVRVFNYSSTGNTTYQREVAPYMRLTTDDGKAMVYQPRSDSFAVADNETVAGVYNYEFGHLWDLRVGDLYGLTVPAGKKYYLWGRNANGAYEYLNIKSVNGQWRNAA